MRSIHSFRSRRQATTSISNLKPTRRRRLKLLHLPKNTSSSAVSATRTTSSSSAIMHKRLRNLQRLVPAGHTHETNLNHLFERTADYIHALQLKLNILKDLTSLYGL